MKKAQYNKWFWIAVTEGILLLCTSVWICNEKIKEREEAEQYKALEAIYSPYSKSTEYVRITMANYKEMLLYKNFEHVKKISFDVPHNVGMEWMCPAEDVERIIQRCGPELTEFSFACCNISANTLKILVEKCPNLKKLYLTYSNLEDIPNEILNLKNLEELDINGIQLKQIPNVIFKLKDLKSLSIGSNSPKDLENIKRLPPEIGQLENLRSLSIFGMPLDSLPEEIGNLMNLESIWISGTGEAGAMKLPRSFGNLKKLKRICMPSCKKSEFPKELEIEKITDRDIDEEK